MVCGHGSHIGHRAAHTSGNKETCQCCPMTFLNNSLNTESLHKIFQQRGDKIAVFEVNLLIVKRDIHATLSLSLSLSLSQFDFNSNKLY